MDSDTIETVTGWASEPYSGGYGGLHELADREFTGAVTDGTAWLFVLNGRFVGVSGGTIESFEDADGTAYAAPDPSLPLLFAMREEGGETRAKYYTNDTPLSELDETLSAGNFTGYVELSENVLSGDYYLVYHGGRRLACAFVGTGSSPETLTGDEAFERADDEVGIYEVRTVGVELVDVPEPEPTDSVGTDSAAPDADESDAAARDADEPPTDESDAGPTASASTTVGASAEDDVGAEPDGPTDRDGVTIDPSATDEGSAGDADSTDDVATTAARDDAVAVPEAEPDAAEGASSGAGGAGGGGTAVGQSAGDDGRRSGAPREQTREEKRRRDAEPTDAVAASESDPFSAEEQWRESRAIPSLDPEETREGVRTAGAPRGTTGAGNGSARGRDTGGTGSGSASATGAAAEPSDDAATASNAPGGSGADSAPDTGASSGGGNTGVEAAQLRRDLQRARSAHEEVATDLADTREQLSETRSEVERLRAENERLEGRVETLQSELAQARARLSEAGGEGGTAAEGRSVSPSQALAGTNLFVRYDSKGAGTLEKAHVGHATREEVNENLRLEVHTEFDADGATVDGRPYDEWLADTIEYGYVEWVVRTLPYEIQDTGNEAAMRALYDAIPKVDRAELDAVVDLVDEQGKKSEERRFDVVLRDRMGDPLVVANVTSSREATTESMLDGLVEGSSSVAEQYDELAAAIHVTASYFEPGALESVSDATGGGLLGRGKHKSFVKLSRKRGFHLCLVESREGEFHVNVPEL